MKTLKFALFLAAAASAPAAYAQVADQPVEQPNPAAMQEEAQAPAPQTPQDADAADMQAPEMPETLSEETGTEVPAKDDTTSEPLAA